MRSIWFLICNLVNCFNLSCTNLGINITLDSNNSVLLYSSLWITLIYNCDDMPFISTLWCMLVGGVSVPGLILQGRHSLSGHCGASNRRMAPQESCLHLLAYSKQSMNKKQPFKHMCQHAYICNLRTE